MTKKDISFPNLIFKEKSGSNIKGVMRIIIELSFAMVGGVNFGLEKSWQTVKDLMRKYPHATWKKVVNLRKKTGKYIVNIS
jgi:hypothetical protein